MRLFIDESAGAPLPPANTGFVRLEIRSDTLYSLISEKALVIEDLRGLDRPAKNWIKQRLLDSLLRR
jgi:hypothetical protein